MLHDCVAEIIPIEPEADNAVAGIASLITYILLVYNGAVFYFVVSFNDHEWRASIFLDV